MTADRKVIFDVGLFEPRCGDRVGWSQAWVFKAVELLVATNMLVLECGSIPDIYASGVKWRKEPFHEEFKAIPAVIRDGHADCEDLAAWLCAQARLYGGPDGRGEPAMIYLRRWDIKKERDGSVNRIPRLLYHVLVLRMRPWQGGEVAPGAPTVQDPRGFTWVPWRIEDPSARMGMNKRNSDESHLLGAARAACTNGQCPVRKRAA